MSNETVLIYAALVVVGSSLFVVVVSTTAERAMCQPVVERSLVYLFLSLGERRGERERERRIYTWNLPHCAAAAAVVAGGGRHSKEAERLRLYCTYTHILFLLLRFKLRPY